MTLYDLLHSDNAAIADAAGSALNLSFNLELGVITQEEYDELSRDIVRIDKIKDLASDLQTRILIEEAFTYLAGFLLRK